MPPFTEDVDYGTSTLVSGNWVEASAADKDGALSSAVLSVCITERDLMEERIGALEAKYAIDRCVKRLTRVASAYNGQSIEMPERDLLFAFDQADLALRAAIDMQYRIADLPAIASTRLKIKIGLSYGAFVADCQSPLAAIADLASTLAGQAESGQILACISAQSALSAEMEMHFCAYCAEWSKQDAAAREALSDSPEAEMPAAPVAPPEDDEQAPKALILKCDGKIYVLNESRPVINIGRADDNHVVLTGRRVSRYHANIRRQGKDIVLTDTSTNGTFFAYDDQVTPMRLVNDECVLHGAGAFSFATNDSNDFPGMTSVKFDIL